VGGTAVGITQVGVAPGYGGPWVGVGDGVGVSGDVIGVGVIVGDGVCDGVGVFVAVAVAVGGGVLVLVGVFVTGMYTVPIGVAVGVAGGTDGSVLISPFGNTGTYTRYVSSSPGKSEPAQTVPKTNKTKARITAVRFMCVSSKQKGRALHTPSCTIGR